MILDVTAPDECNFSHHAEQKQLENSTEACAALVQRRSSASSSANVP